MMLNGLIFYVLMYNIKIFLPIYVSGLIQKISLHFYKCQAVVCLNKTKGFDLVELRF